MVDVKKLIIKLLEAVKARTGYYHTNGRYNLSGGGSVKNLTSYTPSEGTWLILTAVTGVSGSFQNALQNRLTGSIVRSTGDTSISIPNYVMFEATGSNTVSFDTYATTNCVIDWDFTAIKIR